MDNLARIKTCQDIHQDFGTVLSAVDGDFIVTTNAHTFRARQAASCLLRPQDNDRVLLVRNGDDTAFILAVLERADSDRSELAFESDVHVNVKKGRLRVTSQAGMDIAAARDIRTVSEKMHVDAVEGRFGIHDLEIQGSVFSARFKTMQWVAERLESAIALILQRAKRIYRNIEEFEQVRAGRADYLVKKLLSFRSKYTIMTSKEDIKVDGERIHIG